MIRLDGYRVLVTGGSRGIGAACWRKFAAAGATVAVHYARARERAEILRGRLEGEGHFAVQARLDSQAEVEAAVARVSERSERIDCLVNNAGVWRSNRLDRLDLERLQETWRVNVRGLFQLTAALLPLLRRSQRANIVNISSTAGQRGEAFHSDYAASKGAVISATKSWSSELAPEIRVNSVAPGWVDTEMCTEAFADGGREAIEREIPLGRVASPDDIAGPVLFLASPLARHITGEILNVNGGSVLVG